jgi:hypothetical protein
MTDGMIERVARALKDVLHREATIRDDLYLEAAQTVITAMREPSNTMVVAAHAVEETAHKSYAELTKARFTAMIDAALEDGR